MIDLNNWLFEEIQQTEKEKQLGVISDLVEDILNNSSLFASSIVKLADNETWMLKKNFNNQPRINLYLNYSFQINRSYRWGGEILIFQSDESFNHIKRYSLVEIKPELNTEDGSFQEWLTGYLNEILNMFESMFQLQKELPKRHQEVVEFLRQQPNKFHLLSYSDPKKPIGFNIINNPNIHHTAEIEVKLSVSEADSRTRVRFYFNEEDGEELLGTIMLRKGETFEEVFTKDWPWIESQIEAMFVGDRD